MLQEATCHQLLILSIIFNKHIIGYRLHLLYLCTVPFSGHVISLKWWNETQVQGVKYKHPACVVLKVCDMMLMDKWSIGKICMSTSCSHGKFQNVKMCIASCKNEMLASLFLCSRYNAHFISNGIFDDIRRVFTDIKELRTGWYLVQLQVNYSCTSAVLCTFVLSGLLVVKILSHVINLTSPCSLLWFIVYHL